MRKPFFWQASVLATAISLLAACGGGGGDSNAGNAPAAAHTGVLTDAAVSGVAYTTSPSNLSGTTTASGEYDFKTGDTVTFTLGGTALTVPAIDRVTPATIAAHLFTGDAEKIANATINLAVLFQSLDADGDLSNGIAIDSSITLTGFTPSTALAQSPEDFTGTLGDALPDDVDPVSPQAAIKHYYSNELVGTWKASNLKETIVYGGREETEVENTSPSNNLGFLFSFDAQGSFIFSTWDTVAATDDERYGDIAIGQVVYPETGTTVALAGHATRRLRAGVDISATDPEEVLLDPENVDVSLQGDKLVVTVRWTDDWDDDDIDDSITSVLTLSRLQNVKGSLIGSWAELDNDGMSDEAVAVKDDATVSFGSDVSGIFSYFINDSVLAFVVLDVDAAGDENEQNGIVVANYSRSGNTVTIGSIKYDGVSKNEDEPIFSQGETFTLSLAADGRSLAYNYGEGDNGIQARILSRADVASLVAADDSATTPNLAGSWQVTETTGNNTCGEEVGAIEVITYIVNQVGKNLTVSANGHTFNAVLNGSVLNWSSSYADDGGTVAQQTTLTVASGANSFSGSSSWTWSGGGELCSGSTTFTGTRTPL
ncbi:MAG: hypothetical protein ACRERR_01325 [Moraxellaceae bacterium]